MSRKRKNKSIYSAAVSAVAVLLAAVVYLSTTAANNNEKPTSTHNYNNALVVHYLDVGQGDSEFIELPDGKCMLIDAGTNNSADYIAEEITELGYDTIDYLIATHPHADHIGGMEQLVRSFEIGNVYMPRVTANTRTFEDLLGAISEKNLKITTAKAGKVIIDKEGIYAEFLSPVSDSYKDLNNYSCVMKLTYNSSSFLFTGDAEDVVEKELLENSYYDLQCDVLKVGHHGSAYSSTASFLGAVRPDIAVISSGLGNSYNHPHEEALERLKGAGARIYRTDKLGTITIITTGDGKYEVDN